MCLGHVWVTSTFMYAKRGTLPENAVFIYCDPTDQLWEGWNRTGKNS